MLPVLEVMVVPAVDVCLYIYPRGESKVQKNKIKFKKDTEKGEKRRWIRRKQLHSWRCRTSTDSSLKYSTLTITNHCCGHHSHRLNYIGLLMFFVTCVFEI